MDTLRRAIVRSPGPNFADGLTTAGMGNPDYELALAQHEAYCSALERCGLILTRLSADLGFPDSTFVEDTAILTPQRAILTRPGAPSRAGEVAAIRSAIAEHRRNPVAIVAPGTLDGGDVCEAGSHFWIGVSERTNESGARQLADFLAEEGLTSSRIDIRGVKGILHLKSALACIGDRTIVATRELARNPQVRGWNVIEVMPEEAYAANCVRVNDRVLVANGFPKTAAALQRAGFHVIPLDMSEFQKMDGGLSCLSLRF